MITVKELFDLDKTMAGSYLSRFDLPWQALSGIADMIRELGKSLSPEEYTEISKDIWVHKKAVIAPTACINAPCIIGEGTEVRHCAFIRGSALVGKNCVVGNSVEIKNAILFDNVQVPHFNYVGDSILGCKSHLGAGSVTSNVRSDKAPVTVRFPEGKVETGLRKMGAMVGDGTEVGCNAVLNPGTVIGRDCIVYPTSCVRGYVPAGSIYKNNSEIIKKD